MSGQCRERAVNDGRCAEHPRARDVDWSWVKTAPKMPAAARPVTPNPDTDQKEQQP